VLGWWAEGARPGSRTGSALIAGHTVHTGGGALDDLETLRRGDAVYVQTHVRRAGERRERTAAYVVRSVEVLGKDAIARRAEELFSQEVDGRLVLLTCEDWDGTRYLSNVVVTALPARVRSRPWTADG
jgi:LPXTG-site transpeptidase (sortase) family protein